MTVQTKSGKTINLNHAEHIYFVFGQNDGSKNDYTNGEFERAWFLKSGSQFVNNGIVETVS